MDIDVVLPTYNRCRLLSRAIDSFFAALTPEGVKIKLIVVDNNSSDETRSVVESNIRKYPVRISYVFERRQGKHYALNTGISLSQADIILTVSKTIRKPVLSMGYRKAEHVRKLRGFNALYKN